MAEASIIPGSWVILSLSVFYSFLLLNLILMVVRCATHENDRMPSLAEVAIVLSLQLTGSEQV